MFTLFQNIEPYPCCSGEPSACAVNVNLYTVLLRNEDATSWAPETGQNALGKEKAGESARERTNIYIYVCVCPFTCNAGVLECPPSGNGRRKSGTCFRYVLAILLKRTACSVLVKYSHVPVEDKPVAWSARTGRAFGRALQIDNLTVFNG
jgi:hypothetical protein